jgi:hypothetical protein
MRPPVPWIIDYPIVLEQMRAMNMRSLYYNSGAFGFTANLATDSLGWIGPPDPTIRQSALRLVRYLHPPHEQRLASLLVRAWRDILPGRIWIMPKSHWAYELDFGSRDWMPALLEHVGIDPGLLQSRTNAAAIEFGADEAHHVEHFVTRLLEMLQTSDFAAAFPNRRVTCTIHSHKQVWWTSTEQAVTEALERMIDAQSSAEGPQP